MIEDFDAWLFDLDGVVTDTAAVHAKAWKQVFDDYLKARAEKEGDAFVPFTIETDYQVYVDGKPRYEGVDSFLRSRGIELPMGTPEDGPESETVCGIGNRKNAVFNEILETDGAVVFDNSVTFIKKLKDSGRKVAVVTSSKNCSTVLKVTGLEGLFDAQMDGAVAAERKLPGKPKPDTFIEAAKMLGSTVEKAVVIEDAISGVQAGKAGDFGLVIGIDRHNAEEELKNNGAHIVVKDLGTFLEQATA